jgi:hypothetical protein
MTDRTTTYPAPAAPSGTGERPLVDLTLVRYHIIASLVWFFVGLTGGLLFSMQFFRHYPFPGVELLSPGRVRMVHTNMMAYGFIFNAFFAGMLWSIPRLTGFPILSDKLGRIFFWGWQVILAFVVGGILTGHAQAVEWGKTPVFIDPFISVSDRHPGPPNTKTNFSYPRCLGPAGSAPTSSGRRASGPATGTRPTSTIPSPSSPIRSCPGSRGFLRSGRPPTRTA